MVEVAVLRVEAAAAVGVAAGSAPRLGQLSTMRWRCPCAVRHERLDRVAGGEEIAVWRMLKLRGAEPALQAERPLERRVGPERLGKTYPLKKRRFRSSVGNVHMAEPLLFALCLPP